VLLSVLTYQYVDGVPVYHLVIEGVMILALLKLAFFTPKLPQREEKLTPKEEDELLADWAPEPLVAENVDATDAPELAVDGMVKTHVQINGKDKLNLASFNLLGLVGNERIQADATTASRKYGIGSCGPRGFYGTIDCHLTLEKKLAEFMGTEEGIIYSYGFATISSVIPAYCKRGDIIYYDKGVSFATQKGLEASRSELVGFEHNDVGDLEAALKKQAEEDKKDPQKAKATRRFIVVEGLYANHGDIAPLDKLIELKFKYKVRIFLEESMSFGVLGKTGRGITEHFGIDVSKVDAIAASMGNALASIGGFVVGRSYVIDHQRLSGAGYCYSASLPPLLAVAAITALDIIDESSNLQETLAKNATHFRNAISAKLKQEKVTQVQVQGYSASPIVHLRLPLASASDRSEVNRTLDAIASDCLTRGLALTRAKYIAEDEMHLPDPSIRVSISAGHTAEELSDAVETIVQSFKRHL